MFFVKCLGLSKNLRLRNDPYHYCDPYYNWSVIFQASLLLLKVIFQTLDDIGYWALPIDSYLLFSSQWPWFYFIVTVIPDKYFRAAVTTDNDFQGHCSDRQFKLQQCFKLYFLTRFWSSHVQNLFGCWTGWCGLGVPWFWSASHKRSWLLFWVCRQPSFSHRYECMHFMTIFTPWLGLLHIDSI